MGFLRAPYLCHFYVISESLTNTAFYHLKVLLRINGFLSKQDKQKMSIQVSILSRPELRKGGQRCHSTLLELSATECYLTEVLVQFICRDGTTFTFKYFMTDVFVDAAVLVSGGD